MNQRAFKSPPVLEFIEGVWQVSVEVFHWCGHPRYGFTKHVEPFKEFKDAVKYVNRLGFTIEQA